MTEHRVSVLSSSLRRYDDPTKSRDPRIRAVLEQLKTLPVNPAPRAHFRAELRAQLVAVAPRIIADGITEDAAMIDIVPRPAPAQLRPGAGAKSATPPVRATTQARARRSRPTDTVWQRLRAMPIIRPLGVAASVITVFALLLGGAVWLSQKALPGDSMYGLKRAGERVELALASNDTERAQDYLDFATTRVDEAKQLISGSGFSASGSGVLAAGGVSARTVDLVSAALASADSDTKSASRLLGGVAVSQGSSSPLSSMMTWAPQQLARLKELAAAMPAGELRTRTTTSTKLVHAVAARASTLGGNVDCACAGTTGSDELGPVPCRSCPTARTPSGPTVTGPARTTAPSSPVPVQPPSGTVGRRVVPTVPTVPPQPPPAQAPTGNRVLPSAPPLPSLPITLPTSTPRLPAISEGPCVNLLDLIKLGKCPSPIP